MGDGQGKNLLMNVNIWRDGGKWVEKSSSGGSILSEHQKTFFHFEGHWVLAQVS